MGPLLDREGEIERLRRLVEATAASRGELVLVEGEAGIGKTRLVATVRELGRDAGLSVLTARGSELEGELAFGVARELLGRTAAERLLQGAAALARAVVGPEVGAGGGDLFATLHGLYWLVAEIADDGPVLLVVDDAHWCDPPSLRFLAYLAHRLDGLPVSVLVATRPGADPGCSKLLAALAGEARDVLRPAPLGRGAVGALVADRLGEPDDPFVSACATVTGGNPYLLVELLAEAEDRGLAPRGAAVPALSAAVPQGVGRAVGQRLAVLGPTATAVARAVAVLGDGQPLFRVAAVAAVDGDGAAGAVDALVAARLVDRAPPLRFLHPLVRSAVIATASPGELAVSHRRAVDVLLAEGERGDVLVPHLLADGPRGDPAVVTALREAAVRAVGRGAPDVAARYLHRALTEPPPPEERGALLLALGSASLWAGEPDALDILTRAREEATDPEDGARARLLAARLLFEYGRLVEAVRVCEEGIAELGGTAPELAEELEAELLTATMQDRRTRAVGRRRHEQRERLPEPCTHTACMLIASAAVEELLLTRSRTRALELAECSLTGGHLLVDRTLVTTLPSALITLAICGRPRRALLVWDDVIARLRARGDRPGVALASAFRGHVALLAGDVTSSVADLALGSEMAGELGSTVGRAYATGWLVEALVEAGDVAAAEAAVTTMGGFVDAPYYAADVLLAARARLRAAQGRYDEAVTDLRGLGERLAGWGASDPAPCAWRSPLTWALRGAGDLVAARAEGERAIAAAQRWGDPRALAEAFAAAGAAQEGAAGRALLEQAVSVADGHPLVRARALVELGAARRRGGQRVSARTPLREGLDLALSVGAGAVAGRAHEELVAAGARPRRLRTSGADAMTPTERRVAAMAAEGLTTRAVAQALFVGEKTVETHLGSVYRKLGITARSQLAAALGPAVPASVSP
ncbi:helix-turn-helix transcriptional regulator [Actinomycetospora sp. CA-101289]|uniref:helix-turn-helix transcriptional regulator n=1 Tax=Actinomycetospora sp. CA-101289 TaxID=3239893 RepID=UPI003D95D821